ncbi:ABC transporter ATP-binding protein [Photobacterium rosenbergii]|uniref:ABC transporter ATP-binding protein n=1 Tax=Photobacterium rosenbergii TaxID=294936 RepID=UPI001C99D134|nr:ABC transporter ATP-binding protein [Photobacterium rosenbergii]MBY5944762.1 ABC transporter ATP-binding protein [Photobacterium rosenbergii]
MIELKALTKTFGEQTAVKGVSLTVETGQFCTLIGTSGCGKSTTLKMINRLIEPSAGKVLINSQDVSTIPAESLRRRIGYAIQGVGLFPHRNVFDNIATVPVLLEWDKASITQRVKELLELFHLDYERFSTKFPHQLSGGEQQRVGVARALAAKPEVLLMDEPFGALDPLTRESLQDEILSIQKILGITTIMVTHDIDEAIKMADVIAVMDKGTLLQFDTPQSLLRTPKPGFVSNIVGGLDRSLRLLTLNQVADVMNGNPAPVNGTAKPSIPLNTNLRDAVSMHIWEGEDTLAVSDETGAVVGTVSLNDILSKGAKS